MSRAISILVVAVAISIPTLWSQEAAAQLYVRGHLMLTHPSDDSRSAVTEAGMSRGELDAAFDAGLGFGGGIGWVFAERFRAETEFTYLSADVDRATLGPDFTADGDNFASTGLGVNLLYHFSDDVAGKDGFSPYVGLGVVFLNEIDIDLEGTGVGGGFEDLEGDDVAPQLILGVNRGIGDRWSLGGELRYLAGGGIDLKNDAVQISDIDYNSINLGLTLTYWFD